jgi:hypothetical protein
MEDIFNLNIFENADIDDMALSVNYIEFSGYVESLDNLLNSSIFAEAAVGQHQGIKKGLQNTVKTTKDTVGVYDDATDAGGSIMNGTFQLMVNSLALVTKILKFVLVNISKIPLALADAIKYLTQLPEKTIAKVRGDIQLYVTVDDLSLLKNKIMGNLGDFIVLATSFTETGDYKTGSIIPFIRIANDFKTYDAMNKIYKKIANVKFEKSTIRMNNKQVIDTYLSPKSEYYKALADVLKFLTDKKPELEKLATASSNKFDANQIKGVVSNLSPENQLKAKNATQMVSKVISIIGNLIKYITTDISTINKTIATLIKSNKKKLVDKDTVGKIVPGNND